MRTYLLLLLAGLPLVVGAAENPRLRVKKLQEYIDRERPEFEKRRQIQVGVAEELDRLNSEQNAIRQKTESIALNHGELSMALDNLSMEFEKQKGLELLHKQRLVALMKVVHRVKRDGVFRFLLDGSDLGSLTARARILFRALRSHSSIAQDLEERSQRLAESEKRIEAARNEAKILWEEMVQQEQLLNQVLDRKKALLASVTQQQDAYRALLADYARASKEMKELFRKLESQRDEPTVGSANRGTLALFPVAAGHISKGFGKQVHRHFKTVTYHNGIEIEAPHNTPIYAVKPGVVEFEGWVKGMGNTLIIHHGGGFYTVHAHLYSTVAKRGQSVAAGDTIGMVGDTGNSDKPSLYFEVRENGKPVDPIIYFTATALKNLT